MGVKILLVARAMGTDDCYVLHALSAILAVGCYILHVVRAIGGVGCYILLVVRAIGTVGYYVLHVVRAIGAVGCDVLHAKYTGTVNICFTSVSQWFHSVVKHTVP